MTRDRSPTLFGDGHHRALGATREPLDRALRRLFPGASWNEVRRLITTGKVSVEGRVELDPQAEVAPQATLALRMSARRPNADTELSAERLVHVDPQVVVASKPAGVSTVPYDETERQTLDEMVRLALRRRRGSGAEPTLGVVQRLDKQTSGLIVFARTLSAKRHLQQQFRAHSVHRRYLALVHGHPESTVLRSRLVADRGDGLRGSTTNPKLGREAVTHVRVLERHARTSLVECRLETGRTHQIRIHLSEAGHPLLGEPVYVRHFSAPLEVAPRLMLHAAELGFVHPSSGRQLRFREELPDDIDRVLRELRKTRE